MKTTAFFHCILASLALASGGCGRDEPPTPSTDVPPTPASPMPTLTSEPTAPPSPAPAPPLAGTPALGIAAAPARVGDATSEVTLEDEDGNPIKDSLQIMQRAVDLYNVMRFESVSEETDQPWPPLKDLSQLVKQKVLARLPPAPPGKKWVLDPSGKKVTAVPQ